MISKFILSTEDLTYINKHLNYVNSALKLEILLHKSFVNKESKDKFLESSIYFRNMLVQHVDSNKIFYNSDPYIIIYGDIKTMGYHYSPSSNYIFYNLLSIPGNFLCEQQESATIKRIFKSIKFAGLT